LLNLGADVPDQSFTPRTGLAQGRINRQQIKGIV
jgi:hypothetical protein